jgi:hypothetical protein
LLEFHRLITCLSVYIKFYPMIKSLSEHLAAIGPVDFQLSEYATREERHYCTLLFKWLHYSDKNIIKLLGRQEIVSSNFRLFYEYAPIREYLNKIKQKGINTEYLEFRDLLNQMLVNYEPVSNDTNDIQKKKIDLAIQSIENGKIKVYLIEVKFVGGFNRKQLQLTDNYGKIMKDLFNIEYEIFLIGLEDYLNKDWLHEINSLSWEKLVNVIDDTLISSEIHKGIQYIKNQKDY